MLAGTLPTVQLGPLRLKITVVSVTTLASATEVKEVRLWSEKTLVEVPSPVQTWAGLKVQLVQSVIAVVLDLTRVTMVAILALSLLLIALALENDRAVPLGSRLAPLSKPEQIAALVVSTKGRVVQMRQERETSKLETGAVKAKKPVNNLDTKGRSRSEMTRAWVFKHVIKPEIEEVK